MIIENELKKIGEYALAGLYEEPKRSLFYRKALFIRRFYENCKLQPYFGTPLYPSGERVYDVLVKPWYLLGLNCDNAEFVRKSPPDLRSKANRAFTFSIMEIVRSVGFSNHSGRYRKV